MLEYSVKDQFRLANTWISYLFLVIGISGIIGWVLSFFMHMQLETVIISLLSINLGLFIWSMLFLLRVRYLYGVSSPIILLGSSLMLLPFGVNFISFYFIGPLMHSNTILYSSILGASELLIFMFFLVREGNKFYFFINVLQVFLDYYSNGVAESQISWKELSIKLGISQNLTESYIISLVEYDPEIGESDTLNETFTSSSKTVAILQNLIQELENSPQEKFLRSLNNTM